MALLDRETETALDAVRDRHGRIVRPQEAAAIRTRLTRAALDGYRLDLADAAGPLLAAAGTALDTVPPAAHTQAWRDMLDSLATSHAEILRAAGQPAEREEKAVWAHLAHWAENGAIAAHLAELHHQPGPEFTADEAREWTERARLARSRGALDLIESWYAADGRRITLAYLVEEDVSEVIALAGDPDAPGWCVIGRYDNEYVAGKTLPRPVPPGVLRAEGTSRFNRPEMAPEVPVQELLRDVTEAHCAGDVSEALLTATEQGRGCGPMTHLRQLLYEAAGFSRALESVQGQRLGARLDALGRQLEFLASEVNETAEDLGATVAVLPPHRVPKPPRIRPRPALETTPPPAPPQHTTATARRP
ncbi:MULTISPECIES: hypothetical protein [unclassified Streptomyces]|uniref:hypothetical protein n=1 Tax=unclassified Streptomyces TaxID=2593676 RepID=UPI00081BBACC|nr:MULTISPECIES: hypothetical protein [unclassified Streptomyces]MYQ82584.1 hypothetical protein [Streptomyces sp. SID4936]SCD45584.1 hypothetical protein GA0115234_1016142 [Streptomyces sp. DvalAA-43]